MTYDNVTPTDLGNGRFQYNHGRKDARAHKRSYRNYKGQHITHVAGASPFGISAGIAWGKANGEPVYIATYERGGKGLLVDEMPIRLAGNASGHVVTKRRIG